MSGASVAPTIEPVAKITAELAPVSACAAASRTTLERARASSAISSVAVTSTSAFPPGRPSGSGASLIISGTMKTGRQAINRRKRARAMRAASPFCDRSNTRIRLLAGISTVSISARPTPAASALDLADIAHAPFGVALAQAGVEHRVAERGVLAVALERPVEKQPPVRRADSAPRLRTVPRRRATARCGSHWRKTPPAILRARCRHASPGTTPDRTDRSAAAGGCSASPHVSRHAAMLLRCASLRSLGHQVMSGVCRAKCTTCWPVPLPASSTSPDLPARNFCQHRPDRLHGCDETPPHRAGRRARPAGHPCRIPPHTQPRHSPAVALDRDGVALQKAAILQLRRNPGTIRLFRAFGRRPTH